MLEKALSELLTPEDFKKLINALLKNPTGFIGHLLTGVQQGFERFFDKDKVGDNLKDVALKWIAGKLASEGIEASDLPEVIGLPADQVLKNIAGFGLRLLHVTWDDLVGKLASKLGAENLELLKQGFNEIKNILGGEGSEQDLQTRIFGVFTKYNINDLSADISLRIKVYRTRQKQTTNKKIFFCFTNTTLSISDD